MSPLSPSDLHHLVTGATGFIGGRLARALHERGDRVTALVRRPYAARDLAAMGVRVVQGDITDESSVRRAMEGCNRVFHVAAMYRIGVSDPSTMVRVNVEGTRIVLEAMRDLGIEAGVYTSTLAVHSDTGGHLVDESYRFDGTHLTHYDRTKWEAHYNVALPMIESGLPLTIVQPGVVYGPGDTSAIAGMFEDYLRGRLPAVPGESRYSWAHVDDVVDGHLAALDRGRTGECYHLAGPDHTFMEVFRIAHRITGRRPPIVQLPPGLLKALAPVVGALETFVSLPDRYSSEALRATAGVTYIASAEKARRELGFDPGPLEQGLKDTLTDAAANITRKTSKTRR